MLYNFELIKVYELRRVGKVFYKPKYCCECGEKIVRRDWTIWSSGRFCEVCEIDNRLEELFPKVLGLFVLIFGLFGIGSLFWGGKNLEEPKRFLIKSEVDKGSGKDKVCSESEGSESSKNVYIDAKKIPSAVNTEEAADGKAESKRTRVDTEEVYYCGAMTKKGTPCMRQVKGGGRCWQHKGQPAMLKPEELLVRK